MVTANPPGQVVKRASRLPATRPDRHLDRIFLGLGLFLLLALAALFLLCWFFIGQG